jgi:uncharacterized membrane protein
MNDLNKSRIESLDLLRGVVMVIMALDHTRDFFHFGAFVYDPTDMATTTPILFFTRFITHFCAPVFIFLTGTSAFLWGRKRTKTELFKFLFTRGLWLIFIGEVVVNFIWWFDTSFEFFIFQVLWAIGASMMILSVLIYLPPKALLVLAILLIAGHNFLDGIRMEGLSFGAIIWYILHQPAFIPLSDRVGIYLEYPILPWIGVMALGYCFGKFYSFEFKTEMRKKWLLWLGLGAISLFVILRSINVYGDLTPWSTQKDFVYTTLSFLNVTKYPPSFAYLLITIGPALLFLSSVEHVKNKLTNFFIVFGRVPFFYYILHVLFIHLFAMFGLTITGKDWRLMLMSNDKWESHQYDNYGYPLWIVYLVWIGIVILLYPLSKMYMTYKANNKEKWWLSYL